MFKLSDSSDVTLTDNQQRARASDVTLTDDQQRVRASEQEFNFRWIAYLAVSPTERLSNPVKDPAIYNFIAQIGQYSEIAHGSIPIEFVFSHLKALSQYGYPLHGYDALINDEPFLVQRFAGKVEQLQGYVAFRPQVGQLVVAISGTSQPKHAFMDLDCWLEPYPENDETWETHTQRKVHAGFWGMYRDVRKDAVEAVMAGVKKYRDQITEIVVTGHSMGGSLSYFLMMDVMRGSNGICREQLRHPKLRLVVFGAPKVGNEALSRHWTECIASYCRNDNEDMFKEYSLKTNGDGVHILPPHILGYRHLTQSPLYLFRGHLYQIPSKYKDYGAFLVESPDTVTDAVTPTWPLGGHNYYFRDMESLQRRLKWLELPSTGKKGWEGWETRYKAKLKEWEKKYGIVPTDPS
ncbi:alpha/beta-hydrolase [Hysterangium stoloniferum]|nr:alpha/beta-hydrolase [Hysterangium stoloniferum]